MNDLLSVLISTLKARVTSLWTKLRYWTSWNFIKTKILTKIRNTLTSIFEVRPRNKDDYYPLFGLLISRRLARAVVIVVGIVCLCYFLWINPVADIAQGMETGVKVYSYNSLPLRFAEGNVKIKAKSGYIAYTGNVDEGYATGQGQLYDETGGLVYKGSFEKNEYHGLGTLYYPAGQIQYEGDFQNNQFEGQGTLYRENGTKNYNGKFAAGVFEGEGVLFNSSGVEVFNGTFHNGELVYTQLLGKTASRIAEQYTGARLVYQTDTETAVMLDDIDAFYVMPVENTSIEDETEVSNVYVGKSEFVYGDCRASTIAELRELLGAPIFEGNSYITFAEAAGIDWLIKKGRDIAVEVGMESNKPYEEVWNVEAYSPTTLVYLYVFQTKDATFTFISTDKDNSFFMYGIE